MIALVVNSRAVWVVERCKHAVFDERSDADRSKGFGSSCCRSPCQQQGFEGHPRSAGRPSDRLMTVAFQTPSQPGFKHPTVAKPINPYVIWWFVEIHLPNLCNSRPKTLYRGIEFTRRASDI